MIVSVIMFGAFWGGYWLGWKDRELRAREDDGQ